MLVLAGTFACARQSTSNDGSVAPASSLSAAAAPLTPALISWKLGTTRQYSIRLTSAVELDGDATSLDVDLKGRIEIIPVAPDSGSPRDATVLRVQPLELHLSSHAGDAAAFTALERELLAGFVVELDAGAVRSVRVVPGTSTFAANLARTVGYELGQGAKSAQTTAGWQVPADDVTGHYVALYQEEGAGHFVKRKLRYDETVLPSPLGSGAELKLTPEVLESKASFELASNELERLEDSERLKTQLLGSGQASAQTRITLELSGQRASERGLTHAELRARTVDAAELPSPSAEHTAQTAALTQAKVGEFTFETAVKALSRLVDGAPLLLAGEAQAETQAARRERERRIAEYDRAFSALCAIVGSQPGAPERAAALIRSDAQHASFVIDALTSASSAEAQASLLRLTDEASLPDDVQSRLLQSAIRIQQPTAATVEKLLGWLQRGDRRLQALYGLGTMARHLRESGNSAQSTRIAETLGRELRASHGSAERVHILRGIANSGEASLLGAVRPLLGDEDESIRGAAVEALRLMQHDEVDGLIATRLDQDQSPVALRAAVNAAKLRAPTAPLAAALSRAALGSGDSQTRYRATGLLVEWLPRRPELRAVLVQLAARDENDDVRSLAANALHT